MQIFFLQFKIPKVSSACQKRAKNLLPNKCLAEIRENDKNNLSNRQDTKQHQLLRYRRQKLRAIRDNLCRHGKVQSTCQLTHATYSPPVLCSHSKLDFQESLNANFINNLQLLLDGFCECSNITPQNKVVTQKCITLHRAPLSELLTVQSKHKVSITL